MSVVLVRLGVGLRLGARAVAVCTWIFFFFILYSSWRLGLVVAVVVVPVWWWCSPWP